MGWSVMQSDRLQSWYAANDDAEVGVAIAAQVAQRAEEFRQDVQADAPHKEAQLLVGLQTPKIGVGTKKNSSTSSEKAK